MAMDFMLALQQLEKEKGINSEKIIEAVETALVSAYKKNFGMSENVKVLVDRETGKFKVFALKKVSAEPTNALEEISLEEAAKINPILSEGDYAEVEITVTSKAFGRIAAQTAKQVIMQKLRDAEREVIYDEFSGKDGEIVTGIVQRTERRNVIIDLGKTEAILPANEQIQGEEYTFGMRLKTFILEVSNTSRGPQIIVSRSHLGLVKRLFELEVPEIYDGTVEIKSISREPGSRTKIAVYSKNENVDPIGACVGQKGSRVQAVVDELRGEKIDIIKWSINPVEYISSSLSPSKVIRVDINEQEKSAKVTVPDHQLSLAIGKEGQNVRLAARLTGWKIDIKSESQLRAMIEQQLLNYDTNYQDNAYDSYTEEEGNNYDGEYINNDIDDSEED